MSECRLNQYLSKWHYAAFSWSCYYMWIRGVLIRGGQLYLSSAQSVINLLYSSHSTVSSGHHALSLLPLQCLLLPGNGDNDQSKLHHTLLLPGLPLPLLPPPPWPRQQDLHWSSLLSWWGRALTTAPVRQKGLSQKFTCLLGLPPKLLLFNNCADVVRDEFHFFVPSNLETHFLLSRN